MNNYIVVGHYHGKSVWSKFIRLRSWWQSSITHTAILTKDLRFVYEAWGKAGCSVDLWTSSHHKPRTKVELFIILCTEEQEKGVYDYLERTVGCGYDWVGVILGFLTRKEKQDKDRRFCTEWVEEALRSQKLCLQERIPVYKMSPSLGYISPNQKYLCTIHTP